MSLRSITRLPLHQVLKVLKSDSTQKSPFQCAVVRYQSDKFVDKVKDKDQEISREALDRTAPKPEHLHRTSKFDKYCFVWTKRYKSIEDVPNMVSYSAILKCRDLMRIRVSLLMVVAAAFVCYMGVLWGKYDKSRGVTLKQLADEDMKRIVEKYHGKQDNEKDDK